MSPFNWDGDQSADEQALHLLQVAFRHGELQCGELSQQYLEGDLEFGAGERLPEAGVEAEDAARLRASFADYEVVMGTRKLSATEMIDRPVQHRTLVLLGAVQDANGSSTGAIE